MQNAHIHAHIYMSVLLQQTELACMEEIKESNYGIACRIPFEFILQ